MGVIHATVKGQFALVYYDDITIYSKSLSKYVKHVRQV